MSGPALIACCAALGLGAGAAAQSLTPMRAEVGTFTDTAAVRLSVGNPGERRLRIGFAAYDEAWAPITGATATRPSLALPGGETASVVVTVPLGGAASCVFRVCARSAPVLGPNGQALRGEVCGKYRATRYAP